MKLKHFLKKLKKFDLPYNQNTVEYFRFVVVDPHLKCFIKRVNKDRIFWEVRYKSEENVAHPQGKWQIKSGEGLTSMLIYLKEHKKVNI